MHPTVYIHTLVTIIIVIAIGVKNKIQEGFSVRFVES